MAYPSLISHLPTNPLSLKEAESFISSYNFPKVGHLVDWRVPMVNYAPSMWENVKSRIVLESRLAEQSRVALFQEIGSVDFIDETSITDGRTFEFENADRPAKRVQFYFNELVQRVSVLVEGERRLDFSLSNDENVLPDAAGVFDQGFLMSDVILGNLGSNRELLIHGVAYQCNGIELPMVVFGTTVGGVYEFVVPDGRRFLFDGVRFVDRSVLGNALDV